MKIEGVSVRKFEQEFEAVRFRFIQLSLNVSFIAVEGTVNVCRDPDDNVVLECARNAQADIIVTGDQDLLGMREFDGISILTADQYLTLE